MSVTKSPKALEPRYGPARELASRATSKHGNPAAHAVMCSADVSSAADVVIARVYSEAFELDERSRRGDVSVQVGHGEGLRLRVVVAVAPDGESILDRGGFSLAFGPRSPRDGCPRFEGQIRVDQVDVANSRIVAQGRYVSASVTRIDDERSRADAEEALRQIVGLLTTGLDEK